MTQIEWQMLKNQAMLLAAISVVVAEVVRGLRRWPSQ